MMEAKEENVSIEVQEKRKKLLLDMMSDEEKIKLKENIDLEETDRREQYRKEIFSKDYKAVIDGEETQTFDSQGNNTTIYSELGYKIAQDIIMGKRALASERLVFFIKNTEYIYTTRDDIRSEVWFYDEGIYTPNGRSKIKEISRRVLGKLYTNQLTNEVLSKLEADTYIDHDKFFKSSYTRVEEVPVVNGILNIFKKTITPFTPKKVFFNKLPVIFDPLLDCPKIDKFLEDILPSKDDKDVIYEFAGHCLLKDNRFDKSLMLTGEGSNGKTQLVELLKTKFLGEQNCVALPLSELRRDSFFIIELFGKMLNVVADLGPTSLKDPGMYKDLSSTNTITANRKNLRPINFSSYAKFMFSCNELPMVYDKSRAFWRRWILEEFPNQFVTQEEYDESLDKTNLRIKKDRIIEEISTLEEMSGFLNMALEGLGRLQKNKEFTKSKESGEVMERWMRRADSFVAFTLKNLEESSDNRIIKKELRKKYVDYCRKHKARVKSDIVIKHVLEEFLGASEDYNQLGDFKEHFWIGVKFREESKEF